MNNVVCLTKLRIIFFIESKLQISVLRLFCELQTRFANMVYALITRDSVRKALKHGITANQVLKNLFLTFILKIVYILIDFSY